MTTLASGVYYIDVIDLQTCCPSPDRPYSNRAQIIISHMKKSRKRYRIVWGKPTSSIIVRRIVLTLPLDNSHRVRRVISSISRASINSQYCFPRSNVDLLVVGTWIDEDALGSGGGV